MGPFTRATSLDWKGDDATNGNKTSPRPLFFKSPINVPPPPFRSFFLLPLLGLLSFRPSNSQLKEIDNGLNLSIHFIANQNVAVYASLQQKLANSTTRDLSDLRSPPALKARMLSARAISFIDSLRTKMTTIGLISKEDEKSLFDTLVNAKRNLLEV